MNRIQELALATKFDAATITAIKAIVDAYDSADQENNALEMLLGIYEEPALHLGNEKLVMTKVCYIRNRVWYKEELNQRRWFRNAEQAESATHPHAGYSEKHENYPHSKMIKGWVDNYVDIATWNKRAAEMAMLKL